MGNMIERTEKCYEGLNMGLLKMDEAYVRVKTMAFKPIHFYVRSDDCIECPYKIILRKNFQNLYVINTAFTQSWKICSENHGLFAYDNELAGQEICQIEPDVGEFGVYDLYVNGSNICELNISKEPVNIYYPIIVVVLFWIFIYIIGVTGRRIYNKYKRTRIPSPPLDAVTIEMKTNDANIGDTAGNSRPDEAESVSNMEIDDISPRNRSKALDTFRGIAVLATVLFRTSNIYSFIEPAKWDGLHLADLCMPWFMFIMGVCIPLSIKSQLDHNRTKYRVFQKILKRSIVLYILGIIYYQIKNMEDIRFWGVLQRLAVTYFCVANLYLFVKQYRFEPYSRCTRLFYDIIVHLPQWVCVIVCLMIFELVTLFLNVPDCPQGYVGAGEGPYNFTYRNCDGGAAGYIESLAKVNLLVILVLIGHTFIGVQCGVILLTYKKWFERVQRFMVWSIVLGLVGILLSECSGWIPINAKLWSLSYMMITCSSAFCVLSICYFLVEKLGYWSGAPFMQAGRNPIFIYIASEFQTGANRLPFILGVEGLETHFLRLVAGSWAVCFWTVIAIIMYQRKYFVTI